MKKYMSMFSTPAIEGLIQESDVIAQISWAKQVLKKEDRIVWFLRIYRYLLLISISNPNESLLAYCDKQRKSFNSIALCSSYFDYDSDEIQEVFEGRFKSTLKHMMDSDIQSINEVVFGDMPVRELFATCFELENVWKEKQKRIVAAKGTEVMTIGEYSWFNLGVSGCPLEGRAMRHCGNGHGSAGEMVYSLRSKAPGTGEWIPHVTLILTGLDAIDSPGYTTEIKGYANQKPGQEYHEALTAFITSGLVLGMRSGGYMAHNNFEVTDLSPVLQSVVRKKAPELVPVLLHLREDGLSDGALKAFDANVASLPLFVPEKEMDGSASHRMFVQVYTASIADLAERYNMRCLDAFSELLSASSPPSEEAGDVMSLKRDVKAYLTKQFLSKMGDVHISFDDALGVQLSVPSNDYLDYAHKLVVSVDVNGDAVFRGVDASSLHQVSECYASVLSERVRDIVDVDDIASKYKHLLNISGVHLYLCDSAKTSQLAKNAIQKALIEGRFGACVRGVAGEGFRDDVLFSDNPELVDQPVVELLDLEVRDYFEDLEVPSLFAFLGMSVQKHDYRNVDEVVIEELRSVVKSTFKNAFDFTMCPVYVSLDFTEDRLRTYVKTSDFISEVLARGFEPGRRSDESVLEHYAGRLGCALKNEGQYVDCVDFCERHKSLLCFEDSLLFAKGEVTDEVLAKANDVMCKSVLTELHGETVVPYVEVFSGSPEDLADMFGMGDLKSYAYTLSAGHFDWEASGDCRDYVDVNGKLVGILLQDSQLKASAVAYVSGFELADDVDVASLDVDELVSLLFECDQHDDEELDGAITRAAQQAEERGAYDELLEHYGSALKELCEQLGGDFEYQDGNDICIRVPLKAYVEQTLAYAFECHTSLEQLYVDIDSFACWEEEVFSSDNDAVRADLSVPHYGFSGFSEECFDEALSECLSEFLRSEELSQAA